MDDFLEIFKQSFHKFSLEKVKLIGKDKSDAGREYFRFMGKFSFEPPRHTFEVADEIEENKAFLLSRFRMIDSETSNTFRRKFTKKIIRGDEVEGRVSFEFAFDIVPKNVVDFKLDKSNNKMYLYVLGIGTY